MKTQPECMANLIALHLFV